MKENPLPHEIEIFVCINGRDKGERTSCARCGSEAVQKRLKELVKKRGLRDRIRVSKSGCMDRCEEGPNVMVFPHNQWYSGVKKEDVEALLEKVLAELPNQ